MNDTDTTLQALTNQRVSFSLAGKPYSARRATLFDIGLVKKYSAEKQQAGDDANLDLDASLYILCELMKPEYAGTPEQLARDIDLTHYDDMTQAIQELNTVLASLGFRLPQLPTAAPTT